MSGKNSKNDYWQNCSSRTRGEGRECEEQTPGQQNKVQIRVILPFLDQGSSGEVIVRQFFKENIGGKNS